MGICRNLKNPLHNEVINGLVIPEIRQVPNGLQKVIDLNTLSGMQIPIFG